MKLNALVLVSFLGLIISLSWFVWSANKAIVDCGGSIAACAGNFTKEYKQASEGVQK